VFNDRDVLWAMSACFQGDRDLVVIDRMPGTDLDPSAEGPIGAKVGFDCTRKKPNFPMRNAIAPDVLARMNPADWIEPR
jgi:3-polyprenyl-4-hydroxybenzoate decarboxylase